MAPHLLLFLFLLSEAASEPEVIVARVGQDAGLPCQTGDVTIRAVEWIRSDLVAPDYVLFYRDGRSDPTHQHSSFRGRVQLMDDQLKTGDVSLILKDVSREDVGTYECRIRTADSRRKKTLISIIRLLVTEPEVIVKQVKPVGPEVRVELGQDVTLPCQTGGVTIIGADWTRSDPKPSMDILFYSDGHIDSPIKGRVYLDGDLKTGDVSLILKNVSREDVGTYECRVATAGSRRKKRNDEPVSIIQLQVTDAEDQKGHNNDKHTNDNNNGDANNGTSTLHHVGLVAAVVLLVSAVGLFLVRKFKRQREKEPEPSDVAETGDNLL